ncbi:VOC family protein [Companilactobacillus nantensis]|nr:VOC family protein [Companilactobacillus nantensis]GEO62984.1 virulence protein [Companilactobacillus nantensis]
MKINSLDHLVLTVANIEVTCQFYRDILGMQIISFNGGRKALRFGDQKINLHQKGHEYEPKAKFPTPGSADLCLISATPLEEVIAELKSADITIEQGPIAKHGALGDIKSVYVRDPDFNLIEISNYKI